jgi:hypothetical protein
MCHISAAKLSIVAEFRPGYVTRASRRLQVTIYYTFLQDEMSNNPLLKAIAGTVKQMKIWLGF